MNRCCCRQRDMSEGQGSKQRVTVLLYLTCNSPVSSVDSRFLVFVCGRVVPLSTCFSRLFVQYLFVALTTLPSYIQRYRHNSFSWNVLWIYLCPQFSQQLLFRVLYFFRIMKPIAYIFENMLVAVYNPTIVLLNFSLFTNCGQLIDSLIVVAVSIY